MSSRELANLKRELKELRVNYEALRSMVGYVQLKGWVPNKRIEIEYGWLYAWTYPLRQYLESLRHEGITPYKLNYILSLVNSIISQIAISDKYGIKLPLEPKEVDMETYFSKQKKYISLNYDPCMICSENRITHQCHIIPRSEGGPDHIDNYVTLCPLHHHLFDNHRLDKKEWEILKEKLINKMESAIIYSNEVHEKQLEYFWSLSSDIIKE